MKFGDMAYGQNNNSSHRPTKVGEHSGLFHCKIIRLIQYSWKRGFWTWKRYAIRWLQYTFAALDGCDLRIEWKWSIFNPVGTWGRLKGKSKMLFFSERQNYFEEKTQAFCILALG